MKKFVVFLFVTVFVFLIAPNSKFMGVNFSYTNKNNKEEDIDKTNVEYLKMMVFGDMMLGRYVDTLMNKKGYDYPFINIKSSLKEHDLVLTNLEGPITNLNLFPKNNMKFRFEKNVLNVFKDNNLNVFNLANNHSQDQKEEGFLDTMDILSNNGFYFFGDSLNREEYLSKIVNFNGLNLAFVGINFTWDRFNLKKIRESIEDLKDKSDLIILSVHWGEEYNEVQNKKQKLWGRILIDSGADVIFGHHPHVVQGIEIYKNRPIFYSLGNFIFDQYFSDKTQTGLAISMSVNDRYIKYNLRPFKSNLSQVSFYNDNLFLNKLSEKSSISIQNDIKNGIITLKR